MRFKNGEQMDRTQIINKLIRLQLIDNKTAFDEDFHSEVEQLCADDKYDDWDDFQKTIQNELLGDESDGEFSEYEGQQYRVFYHGTSSEVANSIITQGIKLHKLGDATGDFNGSGSAFYVTNDLEQARDWPKRGVKSLDRSIVKFTVSKADLIELTDRTYKPECGWKFYSEPAEGEFGHWAKYLESKGGSVVREESKWREQVRRGRSRELGDDDGNLDYVEGPMCGTPGDIESQVKKVSLTGHQLAIRSQVAADVFNKGKRKIVKD